ncbi:GMC oxidoreductase [Hypholoma sublateritium FD-334 SS-4]|uniref:pyranose dehydrogenase (acceptor) n=1 Tax=Hypholoma sublateritium (strain FD-334 SS-4) TaxID=945553 RepID=A0A0D2LLJ7_HYPSF|nr:GMC oxidoreductase [Hypholoma sublateritium FD-334 SS-4]
MRLNTNFYFIAILSSIWPYLLADALAIRQTTNTTTTTNGTVTPVQTAANTYDYIVVGSGPGGGPLAARLAQAGFSVLLLDAGQDHGTDDIVEIPLFQTMASEYTPITWSFFVDHFEDAATAMQDPKYTWRQPNGTYWVGPNPPAGSTPLGIYYPRASALGGCAEHNALVALYPAEDDWNTIANITGDSSWAAANMRQYWEKLENNQYITPGTAAAAGHGFSGWLDTTLTDLDLILEDTRWLSLLRGAATVMGSSLATSVINTVAEVAALMITDFNNISPARDTTPGIYQIPLSVTNTTGARSSPRDLILSTASSFKLTVQLNSLVTRILFNQASGTPQAVGVVYDTGDFLYRASPNSGTATQTGTGAAFARNEVIISAGTFNTPQLLKLSGIGPAAELKSFGIPVVLDAPGVGTNMQDRYEVTVTGTLPTNFPIYANCTFLEPAAADDPCFEQWSTDVTDHGIYGTNGVAFGVVLQSSVSAPTSADLFVGGLPADFHGYFPGYSAAADLHTWSYLVLKAHSRNNAGTVTLTSTDPRDPPHVAFNSWTVGGADDVQAVYEGVMSARAMFNATITPDGPFTEVFPGPSVQSEADVKAWIQTNAWGHHASCSVPIGAEGDDTAVLDSSFRVKGVNGLRVVDASVFPKIPDFYIVGAVYMISEKAADVIISQAPAS